LILANLKISRKNSRVQSTDVIFRPPRLTGLYVQVAEEMFLQ